MSDVLAFMPSVFELRTPVPGDLDDSVGVVGDATEVGVEDFAAARDYKYPSEMIDTNLRGK